MSRFALSLAIFSAGSLLAAASKDQSTVTYTKDVAPIINKRCIECHRQGEAAPMTFTSYKEVRPWAKAIREATASRKMPPWLADPHYGKFSNDRRMTDKELETINAWVAAGAPEGDPKLMPELPIFAEGWTIGKPDQIIDMGTDFDIPATGTVPYKYFKVPTNFTEDKWIEAVEIRPGVRGAIHHVIVFVQEPGGKATEFNNGGNLLTGYAPGEQAVVFPKGTAKLVRAGSSFNFQLHYTPNGKEAKDRSYVGLRFAKAPPEERAVTGNAINGSFKIPAGADAHEVKSSTTFKQEVILTGFMPHMHVRGKDFKYTLVMPDGKEEVLLSVPKYDFNWQLSYDLAKPITIPVGARIDCVAHFDNSANNKYNPDPTKEVRWGDQTWEEMMIGWYTYTVPAKKYLGTEAKSE